MNTSSQISAFVFVVISILVMISQLALVEGLACTTDADCVDFDPKCQTCLSHSLTCGCDGRFDEDASGGWGCFSAKATVQLLNNHNKGAPVTVAMDKLSVGDFVLTAGHHKNQKYTYEPVYAFGHFNPNKTANFVQIFTKGSQRPLEMTENHLVFVAGKVNPVAAGSVQVGDFLLRAAGPHPENCNNLENGNNPVAVHKIKTIVGKDGVFARLTPSGTIVVDGVEASTYVSLQKSLKDGYVDDDGYPRLANGMVVPISQQVGIHMTTSMFRMICMGVTASACGGSDADNGDRDGLLIWVDYGIMFATFAQERSVVVQWIMLIVALLFFAPIYVMEAAFGPRHAPLIVFALAFSGLLLFRKHAARGLGSGSGKAKKEM